MKILYLSCHAILEYDEAKLLTELGHEVFSFGSYQNPSAPHDMKRPSYQGYYNDHLQSVAIQSSKEDLHEELIGWADVIIVMHRQDWILNNWHKFKGKRIIWRTIGQSTPDIENQLAFVKHEGLQIVRYSPKEKLIPGYIGENALIRFYKDENEFSGWRDNTNQVITVAQSMKQRGNFCNYEVFEEATRDFPRTIYGPENDVTGFWGGLLSYEELKEAYRNNRVYFYTGTYPASYTLNFVEAMMTGIPIVAISNELANLNIWDMPVYEVDEIIKHGENGLIGHNVQELKDLVKQVLNDKDLARKLGEAGRKTAIEYFGKEKVKEEWRKFL